MRIKRKNGLKMIVIALVLLLCLALAVGITGAYYQAKRQATGTLNMDQGIVIDYNGFDKTTAEDWATWTRGVTLPLFETNDAQPGEHITVNAAGIRANTKSVDFYARVKLSYKFYNNDTEVTLANASDLITTSANFFGTNWVDSGSSDGYYYYATGTTLNKFNKDTQTFVDLFATGAEFVIEGENFTGATSDGEGGGFKIDETTSINKIEVYLTLETLQGDVQTEELNTMGWKIASQVDFAKVDEGKIVKSNTTTEVTDEKLNVTINDTTTSLETVKFPYDEEVVLNFDSRNVDYITLNYSNGETETFGLSAEDFANDYLSETALKVTADSSKGTVKGYTVGLWDSEYTDLIFTNKCSIFDEDLNVIDEYTIENGIAVSGYLGTNSSIIIPSQVDVRNRDFKIVLKYDGTSEEYGYSKVSEWYAKMTSIIGSLCFPCTFTGKVQETINSMQDFLNWFPVFEDDGVEEEFLAKYPDSMTITYSTIVKSSGIFAKEQKILEIAPNAFYQNEYVTDVVISDGITKIGVYAFGTEKTDGIKTISLPSTLKVIDAYAFVYCQNLTTINIPENVEKIGSQAFGDCGLKNVVLPSSLKEFGKLVFDNCEKLETVTINSNIVVPFEVDTESNCEFFNRCNKLSAIYVPADLVGAYKADANWSMYADKIQAIA